MNEEIDNILLSIKQFVPPEFDTDNLKNNIVKETNNITKLHVKFFTYDIFFGKCVLCFTDNPHYIEHILIKNKGDEYQRIYLRIQYVTNLGCNNAFFEIWLDNSPLEHITNYSWAPEVEN